MHIPATFREDRTEVMHELIRAYPLGTLITYGPNGLLASPVPFLLYGEEGESGTLRAHIARSNPHWKAVASASECLIIFQGPDGYVTPTWYPSKAATHKEVPTWNYAAVHAWGKAAVIDNADWLERQLRDLTDSHEKGRPLPWKVTDAPDDYVATQMKAIIGIEMVIDRIEGKWKMSQNKDDANRAGVIDGMRTDDDPHRNMAVADLIEKSN